MKPQNNKRISLDEIKRDNPFIVPEHYFDSLGVRVADNVKAKTSKDPELIPIFAKVKPILAFASGFGGLALIIYVGMTIFFSNGAQNTSTAQSEIASNIEYALVSGLDEATLVENLSQEVESGTGSADNASNKEQIINYLANEDIDINIIIDAL